MTFRAWSKTDDPQYRARLGMACCTHGGRLFCIGGSDPQPARGQAPRRSGTTMPIDAFELGKPTDSPAAPQPSWVDLEMEVDAEDTLCDRQGHVAVNVAGTLCVFGGELIAEGTSQNRQAVADLYVAKPTKHAVEWRQLGADTAAGKV